MVCEILFSDLFFTNFYAVFLALGHALIATRHNKSFVDIQQRHFCVGPMLKESQTRIVVYVYVIIFVCIRVPTY